MMEKNLCQSAESDQLSNDHNVQFPIVLSPYH